MGEGDEASLSEAWERCRKKFMGEMPQKIMGEIPHLISKHFENIMHIHYKLPKLICSIVLSSN